MSLRLEMLQVARLAPKSLGESGALVESFLRSQQHVSGAFQDRSNEPDLYYTVFGVDGLIALSKKPDWNRLNEYVRSFGWGNNLDFVHLCCLARLWSALATAHFKLEGRTQLLETLEQF